MDDITDAVVDKLSTTCSDCVDVRINQESFSCFTESPTLVMYRARIEGTSQTNTSFLVSLIESWVRSGDARIIVTQIQLIVDPECSVAISSLTLNIECELPEITSTTDIQPTVTNSNSPEKQLNTTGIIGGIIAVLIILIIIVATIIVVMVILKRRYKTKKVWNNDG